MLSIALVGVGQWGPNIARSFELTGRAAIRWVCDLDVEKGQRVAERLPGARATRDLADVLNDDEVQAVAISTPVNSHFELTRRALQARKHVLVEKPITPTSREARELIRLAADNRCTLMVGHVFEYNASIQALKQLLTSGELGTIHYLSFVRTNLGPVRTDVNALWDLASHDISIMSFFFGHGPVDVTARGQAYLNANIEDAVFATFTLPGNILAHVNVSWLNPHKVRRITVVGSRKMAVWDDLDLQRPIQIFDRHVELPEFADTYFEFKTTVVDGGIYIPSVKLNQPLQSECAHFIECIEEGRVPQSDGENGLRVILALEAATRSMHNGSALTRVEPV